MRVVGLPRWRWIAEPRISHEQDQDLRSAAVPILWAPSSGRKVDGTSSEVGDYLHELELPGRAASPKSQAGPRCPSMEHAQRESPVIRAALLLAVLLTLPALAWAPPPKPLLLSDVVRAVEAQRVPPLAVVPFAAATALWLRECSLRTICEAGDGGTSFGPYQIKAVAAARHCPDVRSVGEL